MTTETLKLFWKATWRYKWLLIAAESGAVLWVLASEIAAPFLVSLVINKMAQAPAGSLAVVDFVPYLWAYIGIRVAVIVLSRVMMQPYIRMEPNVMRDLENLAYRALQRHSMGFYADNFSGALVAKVPALMKLRRDMPPSSGRASAAWLIHSVRMRSLLRPGFLLRL